MREKRTGPGKSEGGIAGVEGTIAKVAEIFALQGDDRMRCAVKANPRPIALKPPLSQALWARQSCDSFSLRSQPS